MRKGIKAAFSLLLVSAVFLAACQNSQSEYKQRMKESKNTSLSIVEEKDVDSLILDSENTLDVKTESGVKVSELRVDGAKICGMTSLNNDILLADNKNGQLLLMNQEGEVTKRIGSLGSGPLEFQNPTGITKDGQYVYVLDDGNSRVQILNHNLEYVKEIKLERSELDSAEVLEDIEVDAGGTIYISGNFLLNPGIIVLDQKPGEERFQEINFCGFLASEQGYVYGLTSGQLYLPREEPISFGLGTGICAVLGCTLEGSDKLHELQGINSFGDFLVRDQMLYCVSQYHNELQKFGINGEYIESMGLLDEESVTQYICQDEEERLYVSGMNDRIFVFQE